VYLIAISLSTPSNCHFVIEDAEDVWSFNHRFDFIHGRALLTCFKDPTVVVRSAFDALEPGGYLELQDGYFPLAFAGDDVPTDSALYRWSEICLEGSRRFGRPWIHAQHYRRYLEEAGFEDVVERRFYWPTNSWPRGAYYKAVGRLFCEDLTGGVEAISNKVLGGLGWAPDKIAEFLVDVRRDLNDPSLHCYMNM